MDKVLQSIVAMANTDGGHLILGIDDPQKTKFKGLERIFGIEENLQLYDEIGQTVKKITPPITGIWPPVLIEVPGRNVRVGMIAVPKMGDSYRSIENHVYIRQEQGNKRLSPQEIVHLAYVKGFERANKELVPVELGLLKTPYLGDTVKVSKLFNRWVKQGLLTKIVPKTGAKKNVRYRLPASDESAYLL